MSYQSVKVEQFGGLVLSDDPEEVGGGAVDLLNVDLVTATGVQGRKGYSKVTSSSMSTAALNGFIAVADPNNTGYSVFVVGTSGPTIRTYDHTGAATATQAITALRQNSFVAMGVPTETLVFMLSDGPYSWSPTSNTFTSQPAAPIANYAVVSPTDNRLVAARVKVGASNYGSRVMFSDAGDGTTWGANNYVDLQPGADGLITGMQTFGNEIYVSKENRLFVFSGTSTDASGNPVFNYRTIDTKVGAIEAPGGQSMLSTPDGVYLANSSGIWRTTGGAPVKVSSVLDPLFAGATPPYFQGSAMTASNITLAYANRRLYVFYATNSCLVYNTDRRVWSYYNLPFSTGKGNVDRGDYAGVETLFFASGSEIYRLSTSTTDNGTAISGRYRSGFTDLGITSEKKVRQTWLEGTGSVTYKQSRDWGALGTGTTVTLGTDPTPAGKLVRKALRGRMFSYEVSGSGTWGVNRVVRDTMSVRPEGLRTVA